MTVESSMPHKTSTSCVVKNAGGKAAGGKSAIMIQTWMVSFSITISIAIFILMYIARFSYRYPYRDLFIAFLKSLWSARNLFERLVLLAIFKESFCVSRFARKVFVVCLKSF